MELLQMSDPQSAPQLIAYALIAPKPTIAASLSPLQ
jgi:hypothetical protein